MNKFIRIAAAGIIISIFAVPVVYAQGINQSTPPGATQKLQVKAAPASEPDTMTFSYKAADGPFLPANGPLYIVDKNIVRKLYNAILELPHSKKGASCLDDNSDEPSPDIHSNDFDIMYQLSFLQGSKLLKTVKMGLFNTIYLANNDIRCMTDDFGELWAQSEKSFSAPNAKDIGATSVRFEWEEMLGYPAPASKVIKDPEEIKHLYNAVVSLPPLHSLPFNGWQSCPMDIGETLHMYFLHGDAIVQKVNIHTYGCEHVNIGDNSDNSIPLLYSDSLEKTIENTIGRVERDEMGIPK